MLKGIVEDAKYNQEVRRSDHAIKPVNEMIPVLDDENGLIDGYIELETTGETEDETNFTVYRTYTRLKTRNDFERRIIFSENSRTVSFTLFGEWVKEERIKDRYSSIVNWVSKLLSGLGSRDTEDISELIISLVPLENEYISITDIEIENQF